MDGWKNEDRKLGSLSMGRRCEMKTQHILVMMKWWAAIALIALLLPGIAIATDRADLNEQFIQAAKNGDLALAKSLLAQGADVNAKGDMDMTALMVAAGQFHSRATAATAMVKFLLDNGADPKAGNISGWQPLFYAARAGNPQVVKMLLDRGADVNAGAQDGNALKWAVIWGHRAVVKLLLDRGADLNAQGGLLGTTVLMESARSGDPQIVELFLNKGIDVASKYPDGRTSLMYAAEEGNLEVVILLLNKGVDVNARDNDGNTALMFAADFWNADVVKVLLDHGAEVNVTNRRGRTPLMSAKLRGDERIISLIKLAVEKGRRTSDSGSRRWRAESVAPGESYPETPAGVVKAFVKSAVTDLDVDAGELDECTDVLARQERYIPRGEDERADRGKWLMDLGPEFGPGRGPLWGKVYVATHFEIADVKQEGGRATAKVLYRCLGWISDTPLRIAECRSSNGVDDNKKVKRSGLIDAMTRIQARRRGWEWDRAGCRMLQIAPDTREVTYILAKPCKYWRIANVYRPYVSVSSAIKFLECLSKRGRLAGPPSDEQKLELDEDIRTLKEYLCR